MDVAYNFHAYERMRERSISDAEVEEVLSSYERHEPTKDGRSNRYKSIANRKIRVTFERRGADKYYVWTVTADEVSR